MSDTRDSINDAIITQLSGEIEEVRGVTEEVRSELGDLRANLNKLEMEQQYDAEEVELVKKKLDSVETAFSSHTAHLKQIDKVLMVLQGDVKKLDRTVEVMARTVDNKFVEVLRLQRETLAALKGGR